MARNIHDGSDPQILHSLLSGRHQHAGRDLLLLQTGAAPERIEPIAATIIKVRGDNRMQADSELHGAALFDHTMQAVVVDQQFAVDVEARAIVGGDKERVLAWLVDHDMTREHQSEGIARLQYGLIHHNRCRHAGVGRCHGLQCFTSHVAGAWCIEIDL